MRPQALLLVICLIFSAVSPAQSQAQNAAPGTVTVRMMDMVDSTHDAAGKQYRAMVFKPATANGEATIPQGSMATVILVKNGSGWAVQLSSITVNGQPKTATSGPGNLTGAEQNAASAVSNALGRFGLSGRGAPPIPSASGDKVNLRAGTTLEFASVSVSNTAAPNPAPGMPGGQPGANAGAAASPSAAPSGQPVAGAGGTLKADVKEVLLGASKPGGAYVVSPDGGHYATAGAHGSREIVIVDGVAGPDFDHAGGVMNTGGAVDVAFSNDGLHSAYLAQRGNDVVAVKDGKEAFVALTKVNNSGTAQPIDPNPLHLGRGAGTAHAFIFSPSGAHYAVAVVEAGGNNYVYLDGAKSANYRFVDPKLMCFAGEKLVYAALTADQKYHLVVNNTNQGPAYDSITSLELSDNDQHYAFIGSAGGSDTVVADGVVGPAFKHVANGIHNLRIASNGRVAYFSYTASTPNGGGPYKEPLYVDNKEVSAESAYFATAGSTGVNASEKVLFSLDGKKFAYTKPVPGGIAAVIDGKVGTTYDAIGVIQFSPDSGHAYYVGQKNALGSFVVVDGQEQPVENRIDNFVFSPNGARYAFQGYAASIGATMTIDGQRSPRYQSFLGNSVAFSPDSKHVVYGACAQYLHCMVIADGATTNVPDLYAFGTRSSPRLTFGSTLYSPDSSKLVYGYAKADGTSQTVITMNGQELLHGTYFTFRSFSPDSQHFAITSWNGNVYTLVVDGKSGPVYDDLLEANANCFRFTDSHTLQFLGVKGGQVYRVTLTLN